MLAVPKHLCAYAAVVLFIEQHDDLDHFVVVVLDHKNDHDWLNEILIETDHRAQCVGSSMMKRLIANSRAQNRPLRLQVLHENDRAKRLYESLGFVVQKYLENHYLIEID